MGGNGRRRPALAFPCHFCVLGEGRPEDWPHALEGDLVFPGPPLRISNGEAKAMDVDVVGVPCGRCNSGTGRPDETFH